MGSRGPAKEPTRLKLLKGETRPSRLPANEPQPDATLRMPSGMSVDAKKVWRRMVKAYGHTGVLTSVDVDVFRAYCDAVVRYVKADGALQESGPLIRGARSGDLVRNPLHQIVRDNASLLRAFARELGFTPASRTGLSGHSMPEADDPIEAFLNRTVPRSS